MTTKVTCPVDTCDSNEDGVCQADEITIKLLGDPICMSESYEEGKDEKGEPNDGTTNGRH